MGINVPVPCIVQEKQWQWFGANLTLDNYKNVLTGQDISYKDADGNTIIRKGSNFSVAVLNSIAVAVPATIIPILIAAFAAYGFAWINFPGRKFFFTVVVALLVVPLQLALVPILQDYTKLGSEWNLYGHVAGAYRLWPAIGRLSDVQLHFHPAPRYSGVSLY